MLGQQVPSRERVGEEVVAEVVDRLRLRRDGGAARKIGLPWAACEFELVFSRVWPFAPILPAEIGPKDARFDDPGGTSDLTVVAG